MVDGVRHAIYADDITLWATTGSVGQIEETLQAAATLVHTYADECGLKCAPAKSELLHITRDKVEVPKTHISLGGTQISEVETIRVLGLQINNKGNNVIALNKLKSTCEQISRMIGRVSGKHGGLQECGTLRLMQAFVISRITYAVPYLKLRQNDLKKLDIMIRSVVKRALGLPSKTSTERLTQLGMHNTITELIEAQYTSQIMRLSMTTTGRQVLEDLRIALPPTTEDRADIPPAWCRKLIVKPLPRNMHPDRNSGRRQARATAITKQYGTRKGVYYVDAAGPPPEGICIRLRSCTREHRWMDYR